MPFSAGITSITQTGTELNLLKLKNIPEVKVEEYGRGNSVFRTYFLENRKLNILGTLTIDPTKETIVFGPTMLQRSLEVFGSGVLNLGINHTTEQGEEYQTQGVAVTTTDSGIPGCCNGGGFYVRSWAHVNWNGASLIMNASVKWEENTYINIKNATMIGNRGALFHITSNTASLNIDGLKLQNNICLSLNKKPFQCKNLYIENSTLGTKTVPSEHPQNITHYIIHNYKSNSLAHNFNVRSGTILELINNAKNQRTTNVINNTAAGIIMYFKEIQLDICDIENNPVEGAKYYISDTDNGTRPEEDLGIDSFPNIKETRIYTQSSNDAGKFPLEKILTQIEYSRKSDNMVIKDFRDESNSPSAIYNIKIISYLHNPLILKESLTGHDVLNKTAIVTEDTMITEKDMNIVSEYTKIDTAEKFYDRAKEYLLNNYKGEQTVIIKRTGNTIYAGDFNVTINTELSTNFSVTENHIKIKTDIFTGNIITTGEIRFRNNSSIDGFFEDSGGKTSLINFT